ncbi:Uncharacterised protein [uncultured archaeon]|nr:Uncharacterised protein [uncultured archaeon]
MESALSSLEILNQTSNTIAPVVVTSCVNYQVIHLALLAVSILFFSFLEAREHIKKKTNESKEILKNIAQPKKDEINTQLNARADKIDKKLTNMILSFRALMILNIASLTLTTIYDEFFKATWMYYSVVGITFICFWIMLINAFRYMDVYTYDPEDYVTDLQTGLARIDNGDYRLLYVSAIKLGDKKESIFKRLFKTPRSIIVFWQ